MKKKVSHNIRYMHTSVSTHLFCTVGRKKSFCKKLKEKNLQNTKRFDKKKKKKLKII